MGPPRCAAGAAPARVPRPGAHDPARPVPRRAAGADRPRHRTAADGPGRDARFDDGRRDDQGPRRRRRPAHAAGAAHDVRVGHAQRAVLAEADVRLRARSRRRWRRARRQVDDGPPVVTGVRLEDDTVLAADLVVATTGRRGDVPAWLDAHGIDDRRDGQRRGRRVLLALLPAPRGVRLRLPRRVRRRPRRRRASAPTPARTRSPRSSTSDDKELRTHLNDYGPLRRRRSRCCPSSPTSSPLSGTPIHDVHCMTGLINRTRSFTDEATARRWSAVSSRPATRTRARTRRTGAACRWR